ncbi:acyl-CoA dehydrogenase family protein [Millisia brevis]|uniref:acyl-CoA dehydrogenase family protein n=1 Tax=Millisia brevis TaxID=264148 RepID=UPI000835E4E4|nr:acyl-CoA dehydrogenase family protein [Millisia brevis]
MTDPVRVARSLADEVLFPAALEVDRTGVIPESHWAALVDAGLFGLAVPVELGGPGWGLPQIVAVIEELAGGCLATAFTWAQHNGAVGQLVMSGNAALREQMLPDLASGRVRGGVAFAGVIPDPPRMTARRVDGGWLLGGRAPFVSGWGSIGVLSVSAGDVETGDIVTGLITPQPGPGIVEVHAHDLVAADATRTVSLRLEDLFLADDRILMRVPRSSFLAGQAFGVRLNGTFPIGVVGRCTRLLADAGRVEEAQRLADRADAVRGRLDAGLGDPEALIAARVDGADLAVRAANCLVAARGGAALLRDDPAQLLVRWAMFTLVAASRVPVKEALVQRYSA